MKKPRPLFCKGRGVTLATSYFRATYRSTIIGAAAFHFRVRNGNGWGHCARITRRLANLRPEQDDWGFVTFWGRGGLKFARLLMSLRETRVRW